jgi:glycosyltransferase involved in cell wall biosynthesis
VHRQPRVAVITGATGHPRLGHCLQSVQQQSYRNLEHMVVIDGQERAEAVHRQLGSARGTVDLCTVVLPYATGLNRWNAHRIYSAFPMLVDAGYVCFLDEDNTWQPDHVDSLMAALQETGESWAFALRNVCLQDGTPICADECESLGWLHPVFYDEQDYLVDASCYMLRRDLAVAVNQVWNRPARPPAGLRSADRYLFRTLVEKVSWGACTLRHTVNYSVGNRSDSVGAEMFLRGNALMQERHPRGLPWRAGRPTPPRSLPGLVSALSGSRAPVERTAGRRSPRP